MSETGVFVRDPSFVSVCAGSGLTGVPEAVHKAAGRAAEVETVAGDAGEVEAGRGRRAPVGLYRRKLGVLARRPRVGGSVGRGRREERNHCRAPPGGWCCGPGKNGREES